ncbi:MAG: hypothetical protein F9K19_08125 [Rhizobiaceae bacterium]|nr:MAG: hypothetical protein F9K19_08125 [Rhizobiaceae bacterium]CAG1011451.1 hypothetical protein RHIZO_04027 [Rhizobiaceae bacterium]
MYRNRERQGTLAAEIRRQIGAIQNTRYFRSLPLFEVPRNGNAPFEELLRQVDEAAAEQAGRQ